MTHHHDPEHIDESAAQRVWSVRDFCQRYRLTEVEEERLCTLLGPFANQHELLSNARRTQATRY